MKRIVHLFALAALLAAGSAFSQPYPAKPIKVVVPWPPAGVTDVLDGYFAQPR